MVVTTVAAHPGQGELADQFDAVEQGGGVGDRLQIQSGSWLMGKKVPENRNRGTMSEPEQSGQTGRVLLGEVNAVAVVKASPVSTAGGMASQGRADPGSEQHCDHGEHHEDEGEPDGPPDQTVPMMMSAG
jgi:hypothetical protein